MQRLHDALGFTHQPHDGAQLPALFQQTLLAVYRRHRQHVRLDRSIGHLERILEANGLHQRLEAPPCVCFVDLTGYTRLTEEQGDAAAAGLAGRLAALVEGVSRRHRGRQVRWLGDGGMFVFRARRRRPGRPGRGPVSRPAADRISHSNHLEPLGPVELKGVAQSLEVFRAGAGPAARSGPGASRW